MSRVLIVPAGSRGLGAATASRLPKRAYEAICCELRGHKERADQVVAACEKAWRQGVCRAGRYSQGADIVRLFEDRRQGNWAR